MPISAAQGLLKPESRNEQNSIVEALYAFFDQVFSIRK